MTEKYCVACKRITETQENGLCEVCGCAKDYYKEEQRKGEKG